MVQRLVAAAEDANVAFLGVNRDVDSSFAKAFVKRNGFEFPVVLDRDLSISRKLGIAPAQPAVLVVDSEGHIIGGFAGLEGDLPDLDKAWEAEIRHILRLRPADDSIDAAFGLLPEAPEFEVRALDGRTQKRSELDGKVVVLVFFLPTCPHCHAALKFLNRLEKKLAHPHLEIVPISLRDRRYVIEDMVEKLDIELAMYVDPDHEVARAYGHTIGVPYIVVVDRKGRIVTRQTGADARIEAILTMEIREALGVENPLLLDRVGYSGEETCRPCHRDEHQTWTLTRHVYAFESLVTNGADRDPECLPCHTVGWNKRRGYSLEQTSTYLEGVQCESCHGRGGPHQSPDFLDQGYPRVCEGCHTQEHSLHFRFKERLPDVSHKENMGFVSLTQKERRQLLERRDKRQRTLFANGEYVGSAACQSCHEKEYEIWARSPHAQALDTLQKKDAAGRAKCQRCHTTGFEQAGGFPEGGDGVRGVGCESCHGPGGDHVKEDAARRGDILALMDKCDSCVILQICGSCHDDENDPGFEFAITEKIDLLRHGSQDRASKVK
jgi:peroxiredoxin